MKETKLQMKESSRNMMAILAIVAGLAIGSIGLCGLVPNCSAASADGAESTSSLTTTAESKITVRVRAFKITIGSINGEPINTSDSGNQTISTQKAINHIRFRVDEKAYVKIVSGNKVLWEGWAESGQPVDAKIDLSDFNAGTYEFSIRASTDKKAADQNKYSEVKFFLTYEPTLPSITGPNTGMYVKIGGRIYSMTTVAILVILIGAIVLLTTSQSGRRSEKKQLAAAKINKKVKAGHK